MNQAMLTQVRLENYRCFERHEVPFRGTTVIVGPNNAGKSTLTEALRLVAPVANRFQSLPYAGPPDWAKLPSWTMGVRPSLRGLDVNFDSVFYRYGPGPARVIADFGQLGAIVAHVGPQGELFGVISDGDGRPVIHNRQARRMSLPRISILPQVGPVAAQEAVLTERYVKQSWESSLASQHFRNQLYYDVELFEQFRQLVESSWPGVRIHSLEVDNAQGLLFLLVQDSDFVAEIAAMGHGLQMWLQVMWFLTHCSGDDIVILDEPDVYMHADLQCRLVPFVRRRHQQIIIATHSVEILSQVDPDEVLVLNRRSARSRFAASLPGLRRVLKQIQGAHNIHIARLWFSRRFLLLEGDDLRILRQFHAVLCPQSDEPIDAIPHVSIGGWSGWDHATRSGLVMKNASGDPIVTYCVLDRDYRTQGEVTERLEEASARGVQLHVWSRKEVENYLLDPAVIARAMAEGMRSKAKIPDAFMVTEEIERITDELKDLTLDSLAAHYSMMHRKEGLAAANRDARERLGKAWQTWDERIAIVPGKEVLSRVFAWSQKTFGVSLSAPALARHFKPDEVPAEMRSVIEAIEDGMAFAARERPRRARSRR